MSTQIQESVVCRPPRVKVQLQLGSEAYSVNGNESIILSEQLVTVKGESMAILKDFITRHNVPDDVPVELAEEEESSEDDGEILGKPLVQTKKTKLT